VFVKQELVHIIQTSELNIQNRMSNERRKTFAIYLLLFCSWWTSLHYAYCLQYIVLRRYRLVYFNSTRQVSALSALLRWQQPPRLC